MTAFDCPHCQAPNATYKDFCQHLAGCGSTDDNVTPIKPVKDNYSCPVCGEEFHCTAAWYTRHRAQCAKSLEIAALTAEGSLTGRPDWWKQAACKGMDTRIWFPDRDEGGNSAEYARRICRTCPVIADCLYENLHEEYGIWGGTTRNMRRDLRARKRAEVEA